MDDKQYSYQDYLDDLKRHGTKTALIDAASDQKLTFNQLTDRCLQVARHLLRLKINTGDRLMMVGVGGIDWVPVFLGCQRLGVVVVPIDTRASQDLIQSMIKTTRPKLIVTGDSIKLKTTAKVVVAEKLINQAQKTAISKLPVTNSDQLGQILLTSGTWSKPKGVSLSQKNLLINLQAGNDVYPLKKDEVFLSLLPLSHIYEQMCGLHMPLFSGCTIVYLADLTPEAIKGSIKKYNVSIMIAVPRLVELFKKGILAKLPTEKRPKILKLARMLRFTPVFLRRLVFKKVHDGLGTSLKTFVLGGAALNPITDKFFQGLGYKILLGYGLSETSAIVSISKNQYGRQAGDVGQILDHIEAKTNPQKELLVRGPSVFVGYWPNRRNPKKWFNTGDLVEINGRSLRITGRSKDMIVFDSGYKVISEEVEDIITNNIDQIEEVIAMSANDENGMSKGLQIAYRSEEDVDPKEIANLLSLHFPKSVKVTKIQNIYPELLSRTHTLKLSRQKNMDLFLD